MPTMTVDPQTGTTFDHVVHPATMRAVLCRHLRAGSAGAMVVGCRVARYRHRPGVRCLVQYDVRVRDAEGRDTTVCVTGQWHAAEGRSDALYRKLRAAARSMTGPWTAPLPPVFFDPATAMVGTTFPWDRRLPSLPDVVSGRSMDVVAPMLAAMGTPPSALEDVAVETVRYREQLNAVCRYTLTTRLEQERREARFFVKAYADDGGARAAATIDALAAATSSRGGAALVQRPVAYVDRLRTLVLADTPGAPLDRLPLDREHDAAAALARVATALARFGQLHPVLDSRRAPAERVASLERSCLALAHALPERASAVAAARARAASAFGHGPGGATHGDIKLEHVFLAGDDVFLIDLDSCHLGDPLWDLALLQARWWAARDAVEAERARRDWGTHILESAYFSSAPAAAGRHLPSLRTIALIDVAAGVVKRREPEWSIRAGRLVDVAAGA